jgi:hypothetical protein
MTDARIISAGGEISLAIKTDGTLWRWGNDSNIPRLSNVESNHFRLNSAGWLLEYTGPGGDVIVPDSVTSIGGFSRNETITSIVIPDSVTEILWNAFEDCVNLESVTLPNTLTSIGVEVFRGSGLKSLIILQRLDGTRFKEAA